MGTLRLLDAIKTCGLEKSVRFYQASTSELYGKVQEVPQTEKTPFYPRFVIIPGMNRLFPETRNYSNNYSEILSLRFIF